jgi:hypothetical protein
MAEFVTMRVVRPSLSDDIGREYKVPAGVRSEMAGGGLEGGRAKLG